MSLKNKEIMKSKLFKGGKKQPVEQTTRITTDTLAEHREQVLAGGRKFKYPIQYQRHRLVINTVIIAFIALVLLIGIGWYLLYVAKNTSEFMYRVTKVVPVPVAIVDGQPVAYSDYLMKYRSAAHYLTEKEQIDVNSNDGKSQLAYVQTKAMDDAIADAYAVKLADDHHITVSDADLEVFLKQQRASNDGEVSEATYETVIKDYYNWTQAEFREAMKDKLLRQKVAYAVDTDRAKLVKQLQPRLAVSGVDLSSIAAELNAKKDNTASYMPPEWVPKSNQDGGLAKAAASLKKGEVSSAVKTTSGNGYYFVRLVDSNETQVQYEYLFIPLQTFDNMLAKVKKDNKLTTFITINEESTSTKQ